MIFNLVARAIYDRILADTGTGGLRVAGPPAAWSPIIAGGIWGIQANPATTTKPYGVFTLTATNPRPSFKSDGYLYTARFDIYDHPRSEYANLSAILDRLYGNAVDVAGGLPTFGLHRWTPTFATNAYGLTAGAFLCQEINGPSILDPENSTASIVFATSATSKEYT